MQHLNKQTYCEVTSKFSVSYYHTMMILIVSFRLLLLQFSIDIFCWLNELKKYALPF